MATGGFWRAAIQEMQLQIKKPRAEVREEKKWVVKFRGHKKMKDAIQRHQAMVLKNHMDGCLPCQNGSAQIPQTRCRCKETSTPPTNPVAPPTRTLPPPWTLPPPGTLPRPGTLPLAGTPPLPGMPPAPPGHNDGHESYEIEGMASIFVYMQSPLRNVEFVNHNAYAKNSKHDNHFIPDLLSTLSGAWKYHWHWFWRWVQPIEWIRQSRRGLIEKNGIFEYLHYLQLAHTLK